MSRRYKNVEKFIHAWVFQNEKSQSMDSQASPFESHVVEEARPYLPLTPLHSTDLYLDSQFVRAS